MCLQILCRTGAAKGDKELHHQLSAVSPSRSAGSASMSTELELDYQLGAAYVKKGRLVIPCGRGNVTLAAWPGI